MIYNNIKSIAKTKGIPICKIEKELDIADGSICKWNNINPGIDKVAGVARILETTVDELIKE